MEVRIEQLYQELYGYIRKRITNTSDAEDVTQDVFLKLSGSDLGKVNNLKSWMYTITRNTITDYYRKKKIITEENENLYVDELEKDSSAVEELSTCMLSFINQLPEDYKRILLLSEINNVPQKEIAEKLNMNYVTVRSKVQRGRNKLKTLFTNCCNIETDKRGSIIDYEKKKDTSSSHNSRSGCKT